MNITYQGVPGSYSHITAVKHFGDTNTFIGTKAFKEIFENLKNGTADAAVVPVENTLAGTVYENYDYLNSYEVYAIGEHNLRIEHQLLGIHTPDNSEDRIKKLTKVYSHIKALEQCTHFFESYPAVEKVIYSDTAGAAQMVSQQKNPAIAAIASDTAAKLYNLDILKSNIEDDAENFTRFLVISTKKTEVKYANKCSLILTISHIPGSLYMALGIFADNKMNLTKIESRPIHGKPFEYVFYVDLEFNNADLEHVKKIIATELPAVTQTLKVLGFYKSGKIIIL